MLILFCSVFKTSLHYTSVAAVNLQESQKTQETEKDAEDTENVTTEVVGEIEDKIDRFYSSIKSRMMVGEVITNIENNAHFTFDFLMLLTLASIIAFIGLGMIIFFNQKKLMLKKMFQLSPAVSHWLPVC